jgi:ankyrin repeat protein
MSWAIIEKIDILDFLFERKADPFIVSVKGRTPFHYACRYNQIAPVKKLLGYSRDLLNQQDFDGMTGLHLAIREGHKDLADFLIKQRLIRKELVNHEGQTVRDLATKKGWHDFVAKYCS